MPTLLRGDWKSAEPVFPEIGTISDKLKHLLEYAVMAPSSRNVQPWQFRIVGDAIELYVDRSRALPVIDPQDREMFIACGAALLHLSIAIRYFGFADQVQTFPNDAEPDLVARIRLGEQQKVSAKDEALFKAIPRRHTSRWPFSSKKVPTHMV